MSPEVGTVLSAMLAAASAVSMVAIALDRTPGAHRRTALAVGALAVATAISLIAHLRRTGLGLSGRTIHGVLTLALAVVATAVWCGNGGTTALAGLGYFAWVPLVAFAYLPLREAVPYLVGASALCVAIVLATVTVTPVGCAVDVMGTVVAGALTAGYFRSLLLRTTTEDHLTGLPNRQALPTVLEREVAEAVRSGSPLAVAVIDLDRFKVVNDTEGHGAGDAVLRTAADTWVRMLDARATLARYGGDEFVAVLPDSTVDRGIAAVERLRQMSDHPCSAGVAAWEPGEPIDATLARADAALYRAKREGRARVVGAPAAGTSPSGRTLPPGAAPGEPDRATGPARGRPREASGAPTARRTDRVARLIRVMGALYLAAGVIYLPQIAIDPVPRVRIAPAVVIALAAIAVGAAIVAGSRWLARWAGMAAVHVGLVLGAAAVGAGAESARGGPEGIVALGIFAWIWMYAFTVLPWRVAAAYCALGSAFTVGYVLTSVGQNRAGVATLAVFTSAGIGVLVGHLNQLLQRQARVDAVTGLPNRAALERELERLVTGSARSGTPLAVAVIDLDHFKDVNDSEGHHAGDALLRRFADRWRADLRPTDRLYRYGGDEFVLVLPGCTVAEAMASLERLRARAPGPCSIGVVGRIPGDTAESVFGRADTALYAAKQGGRNRVATIAAPR